MGLTDILIAYQLMSDPMLREKKFLKCVLQILEAKSRDENRIVCQMAIRGLGNIVYGAPEKVKKHKKTLLKVLIRSLNERSHSEIVCESLKALAKVLKELKEKDIGSSFRDLTTRIRTYLDNEDDGLRSLAFALFGILARSAKRKWKAYFAAQVRESWVTLMLHLQDPSPRVSMVRTIVTYFLSKRHLFPKLNPELLQVGMCRHLVSELCN
uniref:Maestro/Maestro-like HEAT-repeats domain-containing protein n=1 Tax=Pelusios castaneus TaxID=367368 RepID=A0A8C8RJC4_9SAUR